MLKANTTYLLNGVTVREKIIPDGTVWKDGNKAQDAGFRQGDLYKAQRRLGGNTGKAKYVTIHNTADSKNNLDDGELYTRATYNENMGSARVHFYVDDTGAWQNLRAGTGMCKNDPVNAAEVAWHAGDGSTANGGNENAIAIEIIMGESDAHDAVAADNGARIAAWLLHKHGLGIDKLVTHTYWVNLSAGKEFEDVDEQCTSMIYGKKWCPAFLFDSNNPEIAKQNWIAYKATVKKYLDALNGIKKEASLNVGDTIKVTGNTYTNGKKIPTWVKNSSLYVRALEKNGNVVLVSIYKNVPLYTGRVYAKDIKKG